MFFELLSVGARRETSLIHITAVIDPREATVRRRNSVLDSFEIFLLCARLRRRLCRRHSIRVALVRLKRLQLAPRFLVWGRSAAHGEHGQEEKRREDWWHAGRHGGDGSIRQVILVVVAACRHHYGYD